MRCQKSAFLAAVMLLALPFVSALFAHAQDPGKQSSSADLSHVRVVTLSFAGGTVIARMPDSRKWSRATINMPIPQGTSLATARDSFAEVQFENGSTVRLGELSRLDFENLALAPHKAHVNHLTLAVGLATLHVIPQRHDEYVLETSGTRLTPQGKTEFRAESSRGRLRVEVFSGYVVAADTHQSEKLAKNHVLACDYRAAGAFDVTNQVQMDNWDKWVQARDRQLERMAPSLDPAPNGLLYGWDDLVPFGGMGLLPTGDGF